MANMKKIKVTKKNNCIFCKCGYAIKSIFRRGIGMSVCTGCYQLKYVYVYPTEDCAVHGKGEGKEEFTPDEILKSVTNEEEMERLKKSEKKTCSDLSIRSKLLTSTIDIIKNT